MPGVKRPFGCFNDMLHRDLAHDDLDLHLRQKCRVHFNAPVILTGAFLNTAAHDLGHRHARDAKIVQRLLQSVEFCETDNDRDLVHPGVEHRISLFVEICAADHHRHRHFLLEVRRLRVVVLSEIRVLVHFHVCHAADVCDRETGVGAGKTVLRRIQAYDLLFLRDPESHGCPDTEVGEGDGHSGPGGYRGEADKLDPQLTETTAVEKSDDGIISRGARRGEKPGRDGSPDAVHHVHGHRAHRIVHPQHVVEEPDAEHYQDTCHRADHHRAETVRHVTGGCDRHQTCQGGVQTHGDIRLSVLHPGEDHADDRRDRRRHCRGQKDGSKLRNAGRRRAVEAVPAEPEDKDPKAADGEVMSRKGIDLYDLPLLILCKFSDPGSQDPGSDQR